MSEDFYRIPKWFWLVAATYLAGLGHVYIVVYENVVRGRKNEQMIVVLNEFTKEWAEYSTETREEQLRRSNRVAVIDDLNVQLAAIRSTVDLMREDVIILKTKISHPERLRAD